MKKLLALALLFGATSTHAQQPSPSKLPYSPSVRAGGTLYISGQIGKVPNGMNPHGEGFDAAARAAMDAIGKILKDNGLNYADVVKCTVMLDDMADWTRFNPVYMSYFEGKRLPARSAFGTDGLAFGAPVEVECIAVFGP